MKSLLRTFSIVHGVMAVLFACAALMLIIIAAKSLIGFTGDLKGGEVIDWKFLLVFSAIAIGGIIAGSILSKRIPNEKLKPAFGWFVLIMGIYIIGREISHLS